MRRFFTGLIAAACIGTGTANAAEPHPMRTLIYDVVSNNHCGTCFDDLHATMTVAMLATEPDGGLIADVTYRIGSVTEPTARVAIFPDGQLSFHSLLFEPAARLMRPLAVGFVAARTMAVGHTWHLNGLRNPGYGDMWFRIDRIDGQRALFEINDWVAHDSWPARGSMSYAIDASAPISVELRGSFGYSARLVSDSSAP